MVLSYFLNPSNLTKFSNCPTLEISSLIAVQPFRESVMKEVVLEEYFCSRPCSLIPCRVSLGIFGKMICNHKNVFHSSRRFQFQKIHTNQF